MVVVSAGSSGFADRVSRIADPNQRIVREKMPPVLYAGFPVLAIFLTGASVFAAQSPSIARAYASSFAGSDTILTVNAHDPAGSFLVEMVRGRVLSIELERQPVPSNRIVQRGEMVMILGAQGQEVFRMKVDPRGGLRWTARKPLQSN
jgi:hypothetical protein